MIEHNVVMNVGNDSLIMALIATIGKIDYVHQLEFATVDLI